MNFTEIVKSIKETSVPVKYPYSELSAQRLGTCITELQNLANAMAEDEDCTIICGHRSAAAQNKAFAQGVSEKRYPDSLHNIYPSAALDISPYPIDWEDKGRFYMFIGRVQAKAVSMNMRIRCGADWDGDGWTADQKLHDLVHIEYLGPIK